MNDMNKSAEKKMQICTQALYSHYKGIFLGNKHNNQILYIFDDG